MMEEQVGHFFDKKKMHQREMRAEKMKQQRLEKQSKWAARLIPLDDVKKQCCNKKCLNGCIPRPMLESTRKVCLQRCWQLFPCQATAETLFVCQIGIPPVWGPD
jgi:hypothetical protein